MLVSRALPLLRRNALQVGPRTAGQVTVPVRYSGGGDWCYRTLPKSDPFMDRMANLSGAFVWWWVFWGLISQPEHLIGEFPYPDASAWTDEELGVPPDDYDPNA